MLLGRRGKRSEPVGSHDLEVDGRPIIEEFVVILPAVTVYT